ncbi:MAG: hypothetical protein CM1200mP15_16680 [Dehalococcoidia bacterium]|nr:MAG: hypothetical protein CM1200mP15_16680 [Dehalococcoidia bacterium]
MPYYLIIPDISEAITGIPDAIASRSTIPKLLGLLKGTENMCRNIVTWSDDTKTSPIITTSSLFIF